MRRLLRAALAVGLVLVLLGAFLLVGPRQAPAQFGQPVKVTAAIIDPESHLPLASDNAVATGSGVPDGLRVKLPELGIDLPIQPGDGYNVGIGVAAKYPTLAWPGQGHRSLIYAHARPGMFGPLFNAKVGQKVDITAPDGIVLHYVIKQYYPRWSDSDLSILAPKDHEELVLLTCTSYNEADPRIVAIAEPII